MYEPGWLDPRKDPRGYLPELINTLRGQQLVLGDGLARAAADALEQLAVLPREPTPAIINAMERAFYDDSAVEVTGPDDPVAKRVWAQWAEVYAAILEAAR